MTDPELIGTVRDVRGDTIIAALNNNAVASLTFSRGHAYQVGQVGAFVRIPLGLVDLFAIVVQVGAAGASPTEETDERVAWAAPGDAWMRLELVAEGPRGGGIDRGVTRYPAIGDPVQLVVAEDMKRLYGGTDSKRFVSIGHIANAPQFAARIDLNSLISRHSAIVGSTGTGKSTAVCGLLSNLADVQRFPNSRVVVVDVHGEYGAGLGDAAEVRRVYIGSNRDNGEDSDQPRPLHLPYWALTFDELVGLTFGGLDDVSTSAVRDWLLARKREYVESHPDLGLKVDDVTSDTPIPFSLKRLWFDLHERAHATHTAQQDAQTPATRAYARDGAGNPLTGSAASLLAPTYRPLNASGQDRILLGANPLPIKRQLEHLASKLRDPRYAFLFDPGDYAPNIDGEVVSDLGDFLSNWLGSKANIVVADLANVPSTVLRDVVGVLLRILYDALLWARDMPEGGRARPLLVVLEEAHRYLNDEGGAAGQVVERIVKEGRKYGVGLMLVSQRPSEIRATVLSQVGTFLVLRLTNQGDRALVRAALPDNLGGLFDIVPVLRTGEGILVGEATKLPSRVVIEVDPTHRPSSSDPEVVSEDGEVGWTARDIAEDYSGIARAWRQSGATQKGIN